MHAEYWTITAILGVLAVTYAVLYFQEFVETRQLKFQCEYLRKEVHQRSAAADQLVHQLSEENRKLKKLLKTKGETHETFCSCHRPRSDSDRDG